MSVWSGSMLFEDSLKARLELMQPRLQQVLDVASMPLKVWMWSHYSTNGHLFQGFLS